MSLKFKMKTKISALVGICFVSTTLLFNNCSSNFEPMFNPNSSQELASGSEDPIPATPPPPPGLSQPAPAPVVPIVTTNTPSWMAGKNLNEWIEIPNTAGAGGSALYAFSGIALKESNSELIVAAAGGHLDSSDNRVVSLVLETNEPKWQLRIPSSKVPKMDVSHYPDGTPSSRHTYQHNYYVASMNRVFMFGNRGAFGTPVNFLDVDAFNLDTNQWDPPKTWAPLPNGSNFGAVKIPGRDDVLTSSLHYWSASAATAALKAGNPSTAAVWSLPITTRTKAAIRWPLAYNNFRNELFSLQFADGMGYGPVNYSASRINPSNGTQRNITLKANAVLDLFMTEKPRYAAMDYDSENDRYLFYSGIGEAAGRIYEIKPLDGDEWELKLFATTANSLKPPATPGAGINANFKYIPRLKGFVLIPTKTSNVLFMRTSQ